MDNEENRNSKKKSVRKKVVQAGPATTGKCAHCGHAESSHKLRSGMWNKCAGECVCPQYVPQVDISKHNSIDGLPPVKMYQYQIDYLDKTPNKWIMAAETGTGKTFMAIADYDDKAYLKPLLILAPASKINTKDWERDIEHYFQGRITPHYEIYSYEKFSRVPTTEQYRKNGLEGFTREWLKRYPKGFAVICDEVHRAKNPQSGIGKSVFAVATASDYFVGLSATPLPNGWIDAANYYKIFGFVKNITDFKKRYCNIQDYKGFPEIVGYFRESELQTYWNGIAKPLSKQSALDLPPLVSVPVPLPAGPGYVKVQRERIFNDKFLETPSALMHALRQSIIEPKVKWLNDFIEDVSDNVVIFYNYKSERDAILAMLAKKHKNRKVFRQDGEKHEVPNKDKWADLQRTITLAQYQSGSTGIELTYAATTVYFSPTYSYSNYEQSIGRTNRNGQTKKMTLYMLCAPSTLEKDVWAALRDKKDFQTTMWYESNLNPNNKRYETEKE